MDSEQPDRRLEGARRADRTNRQLRRTGRELKRARRELTRNERKRAAQERHIAHLRSLLAKRGSGNEAYGVKPDRVVWIFGSGRTGSTWLTMMMAELPGCARWNEPNVGLLFGHLYYQESLYGREDRETFVLADGFREAWLGFLRGLVLEGAAARFPGVVEEDGYLVIKEPHGSVGAPLLMEALPESRMILLVRDPRDVAASALRNSDARRGHGQRKEKAAERPDQFVAQRAKTYLRDITLAKQAYEAHEGRKALVRYEDLKSDTLGTMRRIYPALQIPVEDRAVAKAVEKHAWENIPQAKKGEGTVRRKGPFGSWKEGLTPKQARLVEHNRARLGGVLRSNTGGPGHRPGRHRPNVLAP